MKNERTAERNYSLMEQRRNLLQIDGRYGSRQVRELLLECAKALNLTDAPAYKILSGAEGKACEYRNKLPNGGPA